MPDQNEIWDEFQWEEFMQQQDKKIDRYMELFYRHQHDPNRDEIIAREMGWTWLLEEINGAESPGVEEDDEVEEGEGWKITAGVSNADKEFDDLSDIPVCRISHGFALRALRFVDQLPEHLEKDSSVVDFASSATIAAAKIAGGTGMGDDVEELGGNIAFCKRGLAAANLAIAHLHEMKEKKIVEGQAYGELMEDATEVRNAIAIYILELREKFQRGV